MEKHNSQDFLSILEGANLGKTKSGKPIFDKDHKNYKLLHDLKKTQGELAKHLVKVFPDYSKDDHKDAAARFIKKSKKAKDSDDQFIYKWIGQIHSVAIVIL